MLRAEVQSSRLWDFPLRPSAFFAPLRWAARRANACSVMYKLTNPYHEQPLRDKRLDDRPVTVEQHTFSCLIPAFAGMRRFGWFESTHMTLCFFQRHDPGSV